MNLANQSRKRLNDSDISHDGSVKLRCEVSRAFEEAGDYESAREALGDLWGRVGERPKVDGLSPDEAPELLLQAGKLTSSLGSVKQVDGAQEMAKNLVSESAAMFERLGDLKRFAEAQMELGHCYWREGAFDEARVMLHESLKHLPDTEVELRARALIRLSAVERTANRYDLAIEILNEAAPLVGASESDAVKGAFHNQFATTLENSGRAERRPERFDKALIEYAAASFHFEQAGHTRYCARVENNLGFLFQTLGKYDEAHAHLERARALFVKLKDIGSVAQVDETHARVLIAQGRLKEAEKTARAAVQTLEAGGEQALLSEALTTHGVALARLARHAEARQNLARAVEMAELGGDVEGAGHAAMLLVEELGEQLKLRELREIFERASSLLAGSQNPATLARLNACARRVIGALSSSVAPALISEQAHATVEERWEGFSLKHEALRYEAELIERALADAGGIVSRAAKLLGFRHHQTFVALLNNRHKSLLHARTPITPRKRSNIRMRSARRVATPRAEREAAARILFVEDN